MIFYKINILKNLLFSITTLLFTVSSFSQLYVQPSGPMESDASYMYVKDEVLYVAGDINLTENPAGATEASIYFRNGGQLIQGGVGSTNTGSGYISILRDNPGYDAWDYAYWSSPVGDQTLAPTTPGNNLFGVTRFFEKLGATEAIANNPTENYNGEESPMRISNRWLYTYTNIDGWNRINATSVVPMGYGFTMKGLGTTNGDQTYDFRGRPNNGNVLVEDLVGGGVYNILSGNPYPSALDMNIVFHGNSSNLDSFKFWDEDRNKDGHYYIDNSGGYGTWVPDTMEPDFDGFIPGVYTPAVFLNYNNDGSPGAPAVGGSTPGDYARRFAPVGQGFMVWGKPGVGTWDFRILNNWRRYITEGSASQFRNNDVDGARPGDAKSDAIGITPLPDYRSPRLRINTYFNESHMRQLVLTFHDDATDGYDRGYDALSSMDATGGDAFFPIQISDELKLPHVIQGVRYHIYKQIPYTLDLDVLTRVVITSAEEVKFDGSAYLYDNVEDIYQEITSERAAELYLPAGTYEDRFFITFVNRHNTQRVANENARNQFLEDIAFFQNNLAQQLEVANPQEYNIGSANIFGMSGKLVYTASKLGNNIRFSFPTGNLSDGIYLVMLTTTDNIALVNKITVKNK
jgi:hypothetical protein